MARRRRKRGAGEHSSFRQRIFIDPSPVKIAKILGGLGTEFEDWKPVWREVRHVLANGLKQVYLQEGAPLDAGRWPPQDTTYLNRKRREGWGLEPLIRTGKTIAQAISPTRGVLSRRKNALVFGVKGPQVRAIQFGFRLTRYVSTPGRAETRIRRSRVRGRPFVGWSDVMRSRTFDLMNKYARRKLDELSARLNRLGAIS